MKVDGRAWIDCNGRFAPLPFFPSSLIPCPAKPLSAGGRSVLHAGSLAALRHSRSLAPRGETI